VMALLDFVRGASTVATKHMHAVGPVHIDTTGARPARSSALLDACASRLMGNIILNGINSNSKACVRDLSRYFDIYRYFKAL
jgi:hypothetical protein